MSGLTIYKSSAGSGKTFRLVLEYLKAVILDPYSYRNVLAITFTNKATEEMKTRIIQALSDLATLPEKERKENPIFLELASHVQTMGKNQNIFIPDQAKLILSLILNDYTNFSVSTIESFFQRIVRAFTRELNIPLGYDVEMKQQVVLQRVVDEMFMGIGPQTPLTKLLEGFIDRNLEEEKSWQVDFEVRSLGEEIFKEKYQRLIVQFPDHKDRIRETLELAKDVQKIKKIFENKFKAFSIRAVELMSSFNLEVNDFTRKGTGPGAFLTRFLNGSVDAEKYKANSYVMAAYEDPDKWYTKTSKRKDDIIAAVSQGLGQLLAEMISLYENEFIHYQTAIQVSQTIFSFGVLDDLQTKVSEYRRENNQLIISDTSFLLNQVLEDQYDAPFIYEKVGNRYRHYLVDEFQDTSDMQWKNLLPLIRDALAQGERGLLVGDVKQSIYRWRNGNMRLLLDVVEQQIMEQGIKPKVEQLEDNWRTAAEIVSFNNQFFQEAADLMARSFTYDTDQLFLLAYGEVSQTPRKTKFPGWLSAEFFPDRKRSDPDDVPSWRELAKDRTLEIIKELKEDGFQGKDITLLVRFNRDGVELAEFLQKHDIKVVSAESLLVASNPSVLMLQALLQHLSHEQDPISLASLIFYYRKVIEEKDAVHDTFSTKNPQIFLPIFEAQKPELRQLPVYECLERLIRLFPMLSEPNAYVQGFMDAVLEYTGANDASISGFLEWWEEISRSRAIASSPEPEAVQITTIHKSKGLEFPIVVMPFVDWEMTPSSRDILWVHPEHPPYNKFDYLPVKPVKKLKETHFAKVYEEEELSSYLDNLNLLYVAFTRPKHQLYILSKQMPKAIEVPTQIHQLIQKLLTDGIIEGKWNEGIFQLGERITAREINFHEGGGIEEKESSIPMVRNESPLSNWNQAVKVKYNSDRFLNIDMIDRSAKISAGELLHEALAYVKTPEDIPTAVEKMLHKGFISSDNKDVLEGQLDRTVNFPAVSSWFAKGWEVRNEAEIVTATKSILRPDRVMIKGQEAMVIDYKTGQPNEGHSKQVKGYMSALEDMGYSPVNGYIYYISLGKPVEVG